MKAKGANGKPLVCEQQRQSKINQTFGIQVRVLLPLIGHFQQGCYNTAALKHLQAGAEGDRFCFHLVIRAFWPRKVVPLHFTHPPAVATQYWRRCFCNLQSHF